MSDTFASHNASLTSPPANAAAVTPSDGTDLVVSCRGINVAAAGNVKVTTVTGNEVTLYIAAGVPFPIRAARIWDTGTTATGIVALW